MPTRQIAVRRIRQFEDYLCGAAAVQMILESIRGHREPGFTDEAWQRRLWDDIEALTTGPTRPAAAAGALGFLPEFERQQCVQCGNEWNCWSATAQAVVAVLNRHLPTVDEYGPVRSSAGDESRAWASLLHSIDEGTPAAALIDGGDHWIVVRGYKSGGKKPTPVMIGDLLVNGLYVRDPMLDMADLYLQNATDMQARLLPVSCAPYADDSRYVTAVSRRAIKELTMELRHPGGMGGELQPLLPPERILALAAEHVRDLLADDEEPPWVAALAGATAGRPQLVQRLDLPDTYYYVVPYVSHGVLTARLSIDAKTGDLGDIAGVSGGEDDRQLPPWQHADDFLKRIDRSSWDAGGSPRVVRAEHAAVAPVMVWKPCEQSRSPQVPFSVVLIGGAAVYVRVDGAHFDRLTRGPRGR
jgi:hypothetical protein